MLFENRCLENKSIILHSPNENLNRDNVIEVARNYGKVIFCNLSSPSSWKITFSEVEEANKFFDEMKLSGVMVEHASKRVKNTDCVVQMSKLEQNGLNQVTQADVTSSAFPQSDEFDENKLVILMYLKFI